MQRTQHPSNNKVLGAPDGMPIGECMALAVTHFKFEDGTPAMTSWWKPTEEELALLNCGHPIMLTVLGTVHPPVKIEVNHHPVY